MKRISYALILAGLTSIPSLALIPSRAHAQAGIAIHVGTLGVGADIATSFGSHIGLRSGFNFFPTDVDYTVSGVPYQIDFASPTFTVMLDLYLGGTFRVSGGAIYTTDDVVLAGEITAPVTLNTTIYSPAQIGTLTGTIVTNELSPYVGIGLGNPARSKFGFFLDLGVAFHGTPAFTLTAVGGSDNTTPAFILDLDAEALSIQNDLSRITVYPVATIGFSIGF
jgi:hypothetical protein